MPSHRRRVELVRARPLSPTVRSLVFRLADGEAPLVYAPGQYLDLYIPSRSGLVMRRSYSVASAPDAAGPNAFEIAVTRVADGPTSEALHTLPVGTRAEIEGPFGTLRFVDAPNEAQIMIAAGTGLAPMRAMLQAELPRAAPEGPPILLLFGCRTEDHVLWGEELRAWAEKYPRFRLEITLSRPTPDWTGRTGYVQTHTRSVAAPLRPAQTYVCGLTHMVEEVVRILWEDLGFERSALHYETYD